MNKKQLELYFKNTIRLSQAIHMVGGNSVCAMQDHQALFETLARNGIEINITLHPNACMGGV